MSINLSTIRENKQEAYSVLSKKNIFIVDYVREM